MTLAAGTRLGPYEIVSPLGAGGMGEVYRARDTRLGREVAIKVLPAHLLADAAARARFDHEARAVAALSHPNILAIHDFGEHAGNAYTVTELLEGETLAQRLVSGPLPLRKALELAGEMAEGLAAAHERGIVHRDLKPANIFLTNDGRLKILDFGLAKSGPTASGGSQTIDLSPSTEPGTILGTVHYMSPEQVRAKAVDHRSDVFSFGSVLYQMLTARQPFSAESAVETMNAICREEPPELSSVSAAIPPSVDRIVRRCLEKKPEQRFQSARDLAFALDNTYDSSSTRSAAHVAPAEPASRARLLPILAGLGLLVLGGVIGALLAGRTRAPSAAAFEPVKVTPLTHTGHDWAPSASPDSRTLAFCSDRDGTSRIWLREMKGGSEVPLTEGNDVSPRFSPDGSSILFLRGEGSSRTAWRVPVVGGQPRRVEENVFEAIWAPDGERIGFLRASGEAHLSRSVLGIANPQSGESRELTHIDGRFLYGLAWSPDGKYLSASATSVVLNTSSQLLVLDAETGAVVKSLERDARISMATWDRAGRTLVVAQSTSFLGDVANPTGRVLRVDPFNGRERTLFWVQSVFPGGQEAVHFDNVADATLVFDDYDWREVLEEIDLTDAATHTTGRRMTQGNSRDRQPAYSRSGDLVIFSSNRSGNLDLWTMDVRTGMVRQITDDKAEDWDPAFTADGRGILWSSNRGGHLEIWTAAADGTGARQLSRDGEDAENPTQTRDGAYILYASGSRQHSGIWRMRSDGSEPTQIAKGDFYIPDVSPDGRHVAYGVIEAAKNRANLLVSEIATGRTVFTTDVSFVAYQSVVQPGRARWMPDGRTLLFVGLAPSGRGVLFAQDFRPGEDTRGTRRTLVGDDGATAVESFGMSPDGKRITVSRVESSRTLRLAEGVPGLD